jgi:hypothetical protein
MKAEIRESGQRSEKRTERLAIKRADIAKGRKKPSRDFSDVLAQLLCVEVVGMGPAYQFLRDYPQHDRHTIIGLWWDERLSLREVLGWRSEGRSSREGTWG